VERATTVAQALLDVARIGEDVREHRDDVGRRAVELALVGAASDPGREALRAELERRYQPGVERAYRGAVERLEKLGAEVVEVSCPHFEYGLAAYYLILPSEVSSNLARFDAMRYGLRVLPEGVEAPSAEDVMRATREAGFGDEVKRRIILGTYALSSGYYDAYYGQAQKIRTLISRDFDAAFERVDVLVSPTAPTTAFKLGEKAADPLAMYLNDVFTIPANLSGMPAISIPSGVDGTGLPVGLQLTAPVLAEPTLLRVANALEAALGFDARPALIAA